MIVRADSGAPLRSSNSSFFTIANASVSIMSPVCSALGIRSRPDQWRTVFASDYLEVLVRNGEENRALFDQGLTSATPYRLTPFKSGMGEQALAEYNRLIAMNDSAVARNGRGFTLLALQRTEDAQQDFERAIGLNPNFGSPYLGLGRIALEHNDPDSAKRNLETALERSPFLGDAYLLLAHIETDQGNRVRAEQVLERGLRQPIDFFSRQKMIQELDAFSKATLESPR